MGPPTVRCLFLNRAANAKDAGNLPRQISPWERLPEVWEGVGDRRDMGVVIKGQHGGILVATECSVSWPRGKIHRPNTCDKTIKNQRHTGTSKSREPSGRIHVNILVPISDCSFIMMLPLREKGSRVHSSLCITSPNCMQISISK